MKRIFPIITLLLLLVSCNKSYQDPPFGGMYGRVEKVTVTHHEPEVWHAGSKGTSVQFITASAYDMEGHEICSAVMDTIGRIKSEAENVFDGDICVRSVSKVNGHIAVQLVFRSQKKNTLEYDKTSLGKTVRMSVSKSSFGRTFKSVVSEDGKVISISKIKTDKQGFPLEISITENDVTTVERNVFDERHNVIEKHKSTQGQEGEDITYIRYFDFDEHGNWREARAFNKNALPIEVMLREIEYWE